MAKEEIYGYFPGGDPREFTPDPDNKPEELENHRRACAVWDLGLGVARRGSCATMGDGTAGGPDSMGFGVYWAEVPDDDDDGEDPPVAPRPTRPIRRKVPA